MRAQHDQHHPGHADHETTPSRFPVRPGRVTAAVAAVVSLSVGAFWVSPASPQSPDPAAEAEPSVAEEPVDPEAIESSLDKLRDIARSVRSRQQAEVAAQLEAARLAEEARIAEEARVAEATARWVAAEKAAKAEERKAAEARWLAAQPAPGTAPAAPAPAVPSGSDWDRLAQCESGGNWSINTGNGYYGGLQFSASSWAAVGGTGLPHQHSREVQIEMGERLKARQGWGAWPHCTRKLGLR